MKKWDKQLIINSILKLSKIKNRPLVRRDFKNNIGFPSATTIDTYFGTFNNALIAAGLTPVTTIQKWDKQSIVLAIQKIALIEQKVPLAAYFNNIENNKEVPYINTIVLHFGSFNEALKAAGLPVTLAHKNKWSDEDILKSLQTFYTLNNRAPHYREILTENGFPNITTITKRFSTFSNALQLANVPFVINNGYGVPTAALDSHIYRSQAEAYFVDRFLYNKYEYVIEPKYPKPFDRWSYDWYIPSLDIYIELTGGLRPERIVEKQNLHKLLGITCLVIHTNNMYKKGFKFP